MKIEFIIPTYNRPNHLKTIVCSLLAQTNENWTAHIVGDCVDNNMLEEIHKFLNHINDGRIRFSNLPVQYNNWGHTPRNYGLENAMEEWVVMTGEDNYYVPTFVDNFLSVVKDDVNFVFCNMVHNWSADNYITVNCGIEYGKIDIGNFMTRTSNAKQLRLKAKINQADFLFVEEYVNKFKDGKIIKIDKFLYVHN